MKLAFDLDGVLVPDCDRFPNVGGLDEFYALTTFMRPLFTPRGSYGIITARPPEYRSVTMEWCRKYLDPMPEFIFHEIIGDSPAEYKAWVINKNNITKYVESDLDIVKYLQANTQAEIIHFDTAIGNLWYNRT